VLVTLDDLPGYRGLTVASERQQAASTVVEVVEARLAGELRRPLSIVEATDEHLTILVTPAGLLELENTPVASVTAVSIEWSSTSSTSLGESFWRRARDGLMFVKPFAWGDSPELLSIDYTGGLDSDDPAILAALRSCLVPAVNRVLGYIADGTISVESLSVEGLSIVPTRTRSPWSGFTAEEWAGVAELARA
jgi:hypothetical protein